MKSNYNRGKVNYLRNLLLNGLGEFTKEFIPKEELLKITDKLADTWFNWQFDRVTDGELKQALLRWHKEQIQIIEKGKRNILKESKPKSLQGNKNQQLTRKQQLFIKYYIEHGVGAKAARLAGYSARTAKVIAFINLRKPRIKALINERLKGESFT